MAALTGLCHVSAELCDAAAAGGLAERLRTETKHRPQATLCMAALVGSKAGLEAGLAATAPALAVTALVEDATAESGAELLCSLASSGCQATAHTLVLAGAPSALAALLLRCEVSETRVRVLMALSMLLAAPGGLAAIQAEWLPRVKARLRELARGGGDEDEAAIAGDMLSSLP